MKIAGLTFCAAAVFSAFMGLAAANPRWFYAALIALFGALFCALRLILVRRHDDVLADIVGCTVCAIIFLLLLTV
jgi:hypothetical protein